MNSDTNLYDSISPKYMMDLITRLEEIIWLLFDKSKYKNVKHYIAKWHLIEESFNDYSENFKIYYSDASNRQIDLAETLHNMPNDIVIKIAIDLGLDTPGFLPVVTSFKNVLKDENTNAFASFNRAIKNVYENPHDAISLANSTLEGIIKSLLLKNHVKDIEFNPKDTLYKQTTNILKTLNMFPSGDKKYAEISKIGSGLLTICQNIETIRSTKTDVHGRMPTDILITDHISSVFIVNSVATIGMFLVNLYEVKYKKDNITEDVIAVEDIPF